MKHFTWVLAVLVLFACFTGCSRVKRVAGDINWIVFDGEPSKDE